MNTLALRPPAALLVASLIAGCGGAGTSGTLPTSGNVPVSQRTFESAVAPWNLEPRGQSKIGYGWIDPQGVAVDEKTKIVYVLDGIALKKIDPVSGRVTPIETGFSAPTSVAVDSNSHDVYVADPHEHKITVIHASGKVTFVTNLNLPASVAVDSVSHELYVGDVGTHEVFLVHPRDPLVHIPFMLGVDAYGLAVKPGGGDIYAADPALNAVFKIEGQGHAVPVGSKWVHPNGVAFDPSSRHLYVSTVGGVWDVAPDGTTTAVGSGFTLPRNVAVDPAANRVYVADQTGKAVYRITNASSQIVKVNYKLGFLYSLAFDTGTRNLYVDTSFPDGALVLGISPNGTGTVLQGSGGSSSLVTVDSNTHDVYQLMQSRAEVLKYTPGGQIVHVAGGDNLALAVALTIDSSSRDLYVAELGRVDKIAPNGSVTVFEKGVSPAGIAVDPHTHDVYVSDLKVVRRYAPDGSVAETIDNLDSPKLLAFDPVSNGLYVSTFGNDIKTVTSDRKVTTIGHLQIITGLAVDPFNGTVYASDFFGTIWEFTP